jgi:hypothetical protein
MDWEIHGSNLAQGLAQLGSDIPCSALGQMPHLLVQLRLDNEVEVSHRALDIDPVDAAERSSTEAPAHHLPDHSRSRPAEFGGQILMVGTSRSFQAIIHAEAVTRLAQPVMRWRHRTPCCVSIHKRGTPDP